MSFLRSEHVDHVLKVTIARPELHNALSSQVVAELHQLANQLEDDLSIRVVIFSGEGDRAFSAGADLKERQLMSEMDTLAFVKNIQSTLQKIASLPMPTIAAINGHAFGGGLELALACDLRVISAHAQLGLTECSLGIIPGAGGTQRLPRLIGFARAMEMIFLAKRIDAQEALSMGLVNAVEENAQKTKTTAYELAQKIVSNGPLAIRAAKEAILASQNTNLTDGLVRELASYHEILESEDRKEGLRAFQEKRPPKFRGV